MPECWAFEVQYRLSGHLWRENIITRVWTQALAVRAGCALSTDGRRAEVVQGGAPRGVQEGVQGVYTTRDPSIAQTEKKKLRKVPNLPFRIDKAEKSVSFARAG